MILNTLLIHILIISQIRSRSVFNKESMGRVLLEINPLEPIIAFVIHSDNCLLVEHLIDMFIGMACLPQLVYSLKCSV